MDPLASDAAARSYVLSVAALLVEAGIPQPGYYSEEHAPTDHFLRIDVERLAVVDVGWNRMQGWFYGAFLANSPTPMTGPIRVYRGAAPEVVAEAVLLVLAEIRQAAGQ